MDSQNKVKKAERKLKRLQHVLFKEMGISCVTSCTNHLAILNAGLVSGLSEELVFEHFSKFGTLKQIILIPGKSCSFVSFTDVNFASNALKHCNGKLNIAQGQKPIYLSYVENLPNTKSKRRWDQLPPGLIVLENFVTDEEETALLEQFDLKEDLNQGYMKHRKVRHYGFEFRYDINNVDKDKPMDVKVPSESNFLWDRLRERMDLNFRPDQLTVNKYNPGQGIPHHIDTHSAFEDPIISLSLQSSVIMELKRGEEHLCVLLPRKSLAVISGESRYDWTHGITPRRFDIVYSRNGYTSLERGISQLGVYEEILNSITFE
ncbi:hypothetical protein NQ318_020705 [Aromia moschata]|uniref:Alkylated DNA repair protein alkB homolog 8 n=1 Tax=Aromia moschata TaxID=1265417 RepID=A0AAV8YYI6_9CUCU|nr:hypothetical protein NQ318_020705 [Aromia moschata]